MTFLGATRGFYTKIGAHASCENKPAHTKAIGTFTSQPQFLID